MNVHAPLAPRKSEAEFAIDQDWVGYSPEDHQVWSTLYGRQCDLLARRGCDALLKGLGALDLNSGGIPDFTAINPKLETLTGWRVVAVPGLIPDAAFFDLLAHRRFPAARFIRDPQALDYLSEPDIFHDVFGHVPMLTDPVFADYMQAYGEGGLRALGLDHLRHLARLYWYTVEFGLMRTASGLKIYGAGIASSAAETVFALEDPSPNRIAFDMLRVMRTRYRIDDFQQSYFVIPSLEGLLEATLQDFAPVYAALETAPDLAPDVVTVGDEVLTLGTQAYARASPHPLGEGEESAAQ
jgi:phenylalanine-4-hydroxylase